MSSLSLSKKEDSRIIASLFQEIKAELMKKKLIELLLLNIPDFKILKKPRTSELESIPKETILSNLSKEELISLLEENGIIYEDEIRSIKSLKNEELIDLLNKTFFYEKKNSNKILIKCLIKLYKGRYILDFREQLLETDNYSVFYFILCNSILSEDKAKLTEEEILNKVYTALVKYFIRKNKIFDVRLAHKSIKNVELIDLLNKTFYEKKDINKILIESLNKLYEEQYITDFTRELLETDNYSIFYLMLCNSILSEDKAKLTEEEILKKVYIALIKIFIEKNKIFDVQLAHNSRINLNIKIKSLEETLKNAGYNEVQITAMKGYYKDNSFIILWYVLNKTNDEIKFSFTLEDLLVKILEIFLVKKIKLYINFLINNDLLTVLYNQTRTKNLTSDGYLISSSKSLLTTKPYLRLIKSRLLDDRYSIEEEKLAIIYLITELELEDLIEIQNNALADSGPITHIYD